MFADVVGKKLDWVKRFTAMVKYDCEEWLQTIVLFLKMLVCFISHRNFKNAIQGIVQKYESLSRFQ